MSIKFIKAALAWHWVCAKYDNVRGEYRGADKKLDTDSGDLVVKNIITMFVPGMRVQSHHLSGLSPLPVLGKV